MRTARSKKNYSMNGTEQENARMSLATDLLKRAATLPPSPVKEKRQPLSYPKKKAKLLPTTDIDGVSWSTQSKRWKAYFYDGNKSLTLGEFDTAERAGLAVRLYKFWRKRGCSTTEHRKPSFRIYTRR